jgi:hypothetical protein
MAIQVICKGCRATFTVSDKFAGRTGPCPKCKQPITIPQPITDVKIHGPEEEAKLPGRVALAPIEFVEYSLPLTAYVAVGVGAVATMLLALVAGWTFGRGGAPTWLAGAVGCAVAWPLVWVGYDMVRDRNLEPYRGRALLVRTLACAAVYAALWGVKAFVPAEVTAEIWPWVFLGPFFGIAGGLAALAALDLDWGTAVAHFSLYVIFTALLRWLAGFMPL